MEILITILWIAYGIFTGFQMMGNEGRWVEDDYVIFILIIVFSPIMLIWRAGIGIFSNIFK